MRREQERYDLEMEQRELDEIRVEKIMVGLNVCFVYCCGSLCLLTSLLLFFAVTSDSRLRRVANDSTLCRCGEGMV
jgi:lantibiotic modifying enzyme